MKIQRYGLQHCDTVAEMKAGPEGDYIRYNDVMGCLRIVPEGDPCHPADSETLLCLTEENKLALICSYEMMIYFDGDEIFIGEETIVQPVRLEEIE